MNSKTIRAGKATAFRQTLLSIAVAACFGSGAALAQPNGPQVINGSVNFVTQGNILNITNSPNAIINWQGFSISPNEVTRFIQQSGGSSVLNRVVGQESSAILGALQSNGKVYLINPNGILFGPNARVDVNGLVASTLDIANQDFLAGKYQFSAGTVAGKLDNQGVITTPGGGQIVLIAPDVQNSGILTSPQGAILLAAGKSVQLVDTANPDMAVVVSAPENQALNLGQIVGQGGKVGIYGALINQRGRVSADNAVVGENGKIVFKASGDTLLEAGSVTSASGAGKGGEIQVLGARVGLTGDAKVDASGQQGGGTVLIGGDYQGKNPEVRNAQVTYVGRESQIKADAVQSGDGGKVIVWADDTTRAYGSISARGGAQGGDGGFVETSGKKHLAFNAAIDASAAKGKAGTILLDPQDIIIADGGSGADDAMLGDKILDSSDANSTTDVTISEQALEGLSGNVTLSASRDIVLSNLTDGELNMASVGSGSTLSLTAGRHITATADVNDRFLTGGGAISFTATGGDINIGGVKSLGGAVTMNASGMVVVREIVTTPASGNGGNIDLTSGGQMTLGGGHVDARQAGGGADGNITLNSGGQIVMQIGKTIYADQLKMTAAGGITDGQGTPGPISTQVVSLNNVSNSGTGSIKISNTGSLSIIDQSGSSGYGVKQQASGGGISITTTPGSTLGVNAPVIAQNGSVDLSGAGGVTFTAYNLGPPATGGGVFSNGGAVNITAGDADVSINMPANSLINSGGGNIYLKADKMSFTSSSSINAGAGSVTLNPYNSAAAISLGAGATDSTANTLELSNDELKTITSSGTLTIGAAGNSGAMSVASALDLTSGAGLTGPLALEAGTSGFTVGNAIAVPAGLNIYSGGVVAINTNVSAKSVEFWADTITVTGGSVTATGTADGDVMRFRPKSWTDIALGTYANSLQIDPAQLGTPGGTGKSFYANNFEFDTGSTGTVYINSAVDVQGSTLAIEGGTVNLSANVTGKNVRYMADSMVFGSAVTTAYCPATPCTNSGGISFSPYTIASRPIVIGGADPGNALWLPDTVVDGASPQLVGQYLEFGSTSLSGTPANGGGITIASPITGGSASFKGLGLSTSGAINQSTAGDIISLPSYDATTCPDCGGVKVNAGTATLNAAPNSVDFISAKTTGAFNFKNSKTLKIGGTGQGIEAGGVTAVTVTTGDVLLGTVSAPQVTIVAKDKILDDNGSSNNITSPSITLVSQNGATANTIAISADISQSGTGGVLSATVDPSTSTYGGISLRNVSTSSWTPSTVTLTDNASDPTGGIINNVANSVHLSHAGDMILSGTSISTSGRNLQLNVTGTLGLLSSSQVSGQTVSVVAGNLDMNGSSITANSAGGVIKAETPGNIRLNDGSSIMAAQDVFLMLKGSNSYLYLNDTTGQANPSRVSTGVPQTTHVTFQARSSAGIVIDGVSTDTTTGPWASASGIYDSTQSPAVSGSTLQLSYYSAPAPAPSAPPPPTVDQCVSNPTLSGCSTVLPTLDACAANPALAGCAAVLPTLDACVTNPAATGCTAVLPTLDQCTANPAATGCSMILPTLDACTANPSAAGCSVVLPTISQCAANPTAAGCSAVLPTLDACTAKPSATGCSVVLPTLDQCTVNPTASGCTAVLPTINQCASNPSSLGCSAVLPTLAACTANPGAAGCSVVLPTMDACTANPAAVGCTAVLPTLDQCAVNPSAAGCSVVLPAKLPDVIKEVEKTGESKTLNQTINQTNNTLNNASLTSVVKPLSSTAMLSASGETQAGGGGATNGGGAGEAPGRTAGSEKQDDKTTDEKKEDKKDDKKKDTTAQKEDKKDDAPKKKQYCN